MLFMLMTFDTSQPLMSALNTCAPANIPQVTDAPETSQPGSPLPVNSRAPRNSCPMLVTLDTSQPLRSPSNTHALPNISSIVVTLETSQWLRSLLSDVAIPNIMAVDVTPLRSGASVAFTCRFIAP